MYAQFTFSGSQFVSCDRDGQAIVWDAANGRRISSFRVSDKSNDVRSILLSPNSEILGVSWVERGIGLFDVQTGRERLRVDTLSKPARAFAFRHYSTQMLAVIDSSVHHWNIRDFKCESYGWYGGGGPNLQQICGSADSGWAVDANDRGVVGIHSFGTGNAGCISTGHAPILGLALAPNGTTMATTSRDGSVKLWDTQRDADRKILYYWSKEHVNSFAYTRDGRTVVAAGDCGGLTTLDCEMLAPVLTQQLPDSSKLRRVELSRDGSTLAALGSDRSCQVWDVKNGRRIFRVAEATSTEIVRLSHDGKCLATPGENEQGGHILRVWNNSTGEETSIQVPGSIVACTFSPNGQTLAVAQSSSGQPIFIDLPLRRVEKGAGQGHAGEIRVLEFSVDGRRLAAAGSDCVTTLWDVETRAERTRIPGAQFETVALAFSPDGKTLVTADGKLLIEVWDIATGEHIFAFEPPGRKPAEVRFSPDGSTLATRGNANFDGVAIDLWPAPRED